MNRLWKKLVKLYHPDRFANEPDKLETYAKPTSAINRAKDNGDIATLREIADDPHGFILRQGWTALDFSEEVELAAIAAALRNAATGNHRGSRIAHGIERKSRL